MKLNWKVQPKPPGRYSFEKRDWPIATFDGDKVAAYISSREGYSGPNGKAENLSFELKVHVAIKSVEDPNAGWKWATLEARAHSVAEAKNLAESFFDKHPELVP